MKVNINKEWVKRNLGLIIGGAVALGLMVFAGIYLYSQMQEDERITAELDTATARFRELTDRKVHPGNERVDNIKIAQEDHERLQQFLKTVKGRIVSPELPKDLTNKDFRALLDNTIAELQQGAEKNGISLPGGKDYWFTFAAQRSSVDFKPLEALAYQLMDVKAITEVLYQAKVHDLISIKRVPVATEDSGYTDYLDKKATTNDYAIITPYEITFQGFSSELARVLEGFINTKQCMIVKTIGVDKAPAAAPAAAPAMNPMMSPSFRGGGRYGPRMSQPMPQPVARPAQRGLTTLLDENKLRFTLLINSIRSKPEEEKSSQPQEVVPAATEEGAEATGG
ncbi:MAG: hypothetical protein ACO1QB_09235 [Verrucomicrobiales bacterium]